MSHKLEAYKLADAHGMTIQNYASSYHGEMFGNLMVSLPEGYQLSDTDNRTGISCEGCGLSINDFWKYVREDIKELVSWKEDWKKIETEQSERES
jgi:hypothetical protein